MVATNVDAEFADSVSLSGGIYTAAAPSGKALQQSKKEIGAEWALTLTLMLVNVLIRFAL